MGTSRFAIARCLVWCRPGRTDGSTDRGYRAIQNLQVFPGLGGGRSRTRTYGPLIKSQLLYQLSYAPAGPSARVGGPIASMPRIAKAGDCQDRCWTRVRPGAHVSPCQTAGRPLFAGFARRAEESPGSTGIRCRPTAGGGDPRESATENKPPAPPGSFRGRGQG